MGQSFSPQMKKLTGLSFAGVLLVAGLATLYFASTPETPKAGPSLRSHATAGTATTARSSLSTADKSAPASASCDVTGSKWSSTSPNEFAEFRDWTARYLAAAPSARAKLLAEGIALAKARRLALSSLIKEDPENALALAVPMTVRQQLPAEILALLEERVSGRGELALIGKTSIEGQPATNSVYRSALIGSQEYTAYVYGRRVRQTTLPATSLVGIALDGRMAVNESPVRVLEAGELANGRPVSEICDISGKSTVVDPAAPLNVSTATAVEYNGTVHILCSAAHLAELEKRLKSQESALSGAGEETELAASPVSGRPPTSWSQGSKKLLIIRVDFSDLPGTPLSYGTTTPIDDTRTFNLINSANGVRDYYVKASYGKTTLVTATTDITPVLRVPQTASYYAVGDYNSLLHSDARAAALTAGYDSNNYDRIAVVFTYLGNLPSSQINYGGLGEITGKNFWVNGEYDLRVVAHELGHTYGLYHANLWQVSDGNAVSATGSSTEYGDRFDVMGNGGAYQYDFSHWNKNILQWIPDSSILTATTAGTYRVYRFDGVQAANLANPRVLKVARDATRDFWIGYRRGSGNASLNGGAYILWGYQYNQQGNLLDMTTPGTSPGGTDDDGLAIGTSFYDSVSGVTIRPVAQGGSGTEEYLDVLVSFGAPLNGLSYGTSNFPATVTAGSTVNFTYNVTNSGNKVWGTNHLLALRQFDYTVVQMGALGTTAVGGTKAVAYSFTAPLTAGTYQYRVQPLENGVEWFGSEVILTLNVTGSVTPVNGLTYGSTTFPTTVSAGATVNFTYNVTNSGTKTWASNHFLALRQFDYTMVQLGALATTAANGTKAVAYSFTAPSTPGIYQYRVQPLENGVEWFGSEVILTLNVGGVTPQVNGLTYGSTTFPANASPGATVNFTYSVTNSGTKAWGANHLLAFRKFDYTIVQMGALSTTAPAGSKAVAYSFTAPSTPGIYQYRIQPLENGVEWFGSEIILTLNVGGVGPQVNGLTYGSNTFPANASPGATVNFTYNVTNSGTKTWASNHFLALRQFDYTMVQMGALATTAAAGSKAVAYSFTAPSTPGIYQYRIQPLENGVEWFGTEVILTLNVGGVTPQVNGLTYGSRTFPASVTAGATVNFTYNVTNSGTKAWGANHLLALRKFDYTVVQMGALGTTAAAGSKAVAYSFTAPSTPGTYQYRVQPLENGVEWFGSEVILTLQVLGGITAGESTITIAATDDFNGDGQPDILWQDLVTGECGIRLMQGDTVSSTVSLGEMPPEWKIVGTGDFDEDGQTDIFWQNTATDEYSVWLMHGTTVSRVVPLSGPPGG